MLNHHGLDLIDSDQKYAGRYALSIFKCTCNMAVLDTLANVYLPA